MAKAIHPLMADENVERTMLCQNAERACRSYRLVSLTTIADWPAGLSAVHWRYAQQNLPSSHPSDNWPNLKLESSTANYSVNLCAQRSTRLGHTRAFDTFLTTTVLSLSRHSAPLHLWDLSPSRIPVPFRLIPPRAMLLKQLSRSQVFEQWWAVLHWMDGWGLKLKLRWRASARVHWRV